MPAASAYSMQYDVLLKALIIGAPGAGKSSLLLRYADDQFDASYLATIGVDFRVSTFERDGKLIKLQTWDTAGQDRFRAITVSYYRGAHCVLLVYDVTDRQSFECVPAWLKELEQNGASEDVQVVLVANKCDRAAERVISTEQGRDLADYHGILYAEASAKTARGVQEAFAKVIDRALPLRLKDIAQKKENEKVLLDGKRVSGQPTCMQRMAKWLGW